MFSRRFKLNYTVGGIIGLGATGATTFEGIVAGSTNAIRIILVIYLD